MSTRLMGPCPGVARARPGPGVLALLALVLQAACTTDSGVRRGERYGYDNSVSAACRQNPGNCAALSGREAAFEPIRQVGTAVASVAAVLKVLDEQTKGSIEEALSRCADRARSEVLLRHPKDFKGPTPDAGECKQSTVDARGRSVTWAMRLGTEMHEAARACAEEHLGKLWPGRFSLEQRYRYDSRTGRKKVVTPEEERALVETGNAGELKGTLKPDVVIHSGDPLDIQAIYDFKFPCVNTDRVPEWDDYPEGHPYQDSNQGEMYKQLLGPSVQPPES